MHLKHHSSDQAGWPDEFVKNFAQNAAQAMFCQN
jgi:hypothetical protein